MEEHMMYVKDWLDQEKNELDLFLEYIEALGDYNPNTEVMWRTPSAFREAFKAWRAEEFE